MAAVVGVVACTELERVGVACAAIYIIKCLLLSAIGIFFILFKRRFLYEFSAMRGPPAHEAKTRHQLIALSLSSHTHTDARTVLSTNSAASIATRYRYLILTGGALLDGGAALLNR